MPDIHHGARRVMAGVRYCIVEWLRMVRWRKRIEESALAPSGLTFSQWLVLDATRALFRATEDAVSQSDVAAHLEMKWPREWLHTMHPLRVVWLADFLDDRCPGSGEQARTKTASRGGGQPRNLRWS